MNASKMKLLYPNCNIDGSEEVKREHAQKYHNDSIWMAMDNFDMFFEVEKELIDEVRVEEASYHGKDSPL